MARKIWKLEDIPVIEDLKGIVESLIGEDGKEYPDPHRKFIQSDVRPPSLKEQIERILTSRKLMAEMVQNGIETIEEADDFDVGEMDDAAPSGYEVMEDEVLNSDVLRPASEESVSQTKTQLDDSPEAGEDPGRGSAPDSGSEGN